MAQCIVIRLMLMIPVLIGISILAFGFMRSGPGDVLEVAHAGLPLSTAAGRHLGALLGGTVIIEGIFSLPGAGRRTLSALQHRDFPS